MNAKFRLIFLIICASFALSAHIFAAETNSVSAPPSAPPAEAVAPVAVTLNGYLQIQEQLHATQLSIENNRQEAAATAQRNADAMAVRIQVLEQTIAAQHAADVEAARKSQQFFLILAGTFGVVGLGIVVLLIYFQWRAFAQLVEFSTQQTSALALANGSGNGNGRALPSVEALHEFSPAARGAVENSSTRLFSVVDTLEKRILELEQSARKPLAATTSTSTVPKQNGVQNGWVQNGISADAKDRDECVANLLAEGQKLLDANEAARALECFDVALNLQPEHGEALVKKGGALEKLTRLDEAIACYDRAIAANGTLTIAYLHKGGLFNRMARYDEALQCYERALQTQEKNSAAKVS
jgi:tetratricopeptide (TPR) repeat protein